MSSLVLREIWPAPGRLFSPWCRLLVCLVMVACAGCAGTPHNTVSTLGGHEAGARLDQASEAERVEALTNEIRMLAARVSAAEAADCARRAIKYAELLRDEYGIKEPIEWNNILVNMGMKKRGLCYELADDLQAELKAQRYATLRFQRATAHWHDLIDEHNCVVVTAVGQGFKEGLVLDPWRNAGRLRWARVKLDHYPWVPRNPEAASDDGVLATTRPAGSAGTATGG